MRILLALLTITMASCSTVRLAIYDYQKRHAYANSTSTEEASITPVHTTSETHSKEKLAKLALTKHAEKYIGANYRYGSCDPSKGFDCSGFVYHVAKSQEISLPRSSSLMADSGPRISWKKAEPGDLIFFGDGNRVNHVGIVEKNKGDEVWIIHSSSSNGVIRENIMESNYWKSRVLFSMDIISPKNQRT